MENGKWKKEKGVKIGQRLKDKDWRLEGKG